MHKAAHWVLDGPILEDAGDAGGDIQVGPAFSARFRSDDCPEARFEVTAYATAKPYSELKEDAPECPHDRESLERNATAQAEHLACSYKPGTADVQELITYRMNGRMVDGIYESDDTDPMVYDWVGSPYDYPGDTLAEQVANATKDAEKHVRYVASTINEHFSWDGLTPPQD